jgi:uncharacterized membrane protein
MRFKVVGQIIRVTPRTKTVEIVISTVKYGTFNICYFINDNETIQQVVNNLKPLYNNEVEATGRTKQDDQSNTTRYYLDSLSKVFLRKFNQ